MRTVTFPIAVILCWMVGTVGCERQQSPPLAKQAGVKVPPHETNAEKPGRREHAKRAERLEPTKNDAQSPEATNEGAKRDLKRATDELLKKLLSEANSGKPIQEPTPLTMPLANPEPPAATPESTEQEDAFKSNLRVDVPLPFEVPTDWTRLSKDEDVWIDKQGKRAAAAGRICLTQGVLEMFACPKYTKEHESVVAINALSSHVHQALLLLGAEPGSPVVWDPDYKAAHGPKIEIEVWFQDENKQLIKRSAKEMVRNVRDKKPLHIDWVFGGSRFIKHPVDGSEVYTGNGGEFVCVSNFSSATIDLPIESSQSEGQLLFDAFTENIPDLGTPVLLVFNPVLITE